MTISIGKCRTNLKRLPQLSQLQSDYEKYKKEWGIDKCLENYLIIDLKSGKGNFVASLRYILSRYRLKWKAIWVKVG